MQGISTAALASTLGTVGIILVAVIVVAILMGQRKGAKGAGSTSKNQIFFIGINFEHFRKERFKETFTIWIDQ